VKNRPIGIFDSGVGGLTVLMKVKKALPKESVIYVGDTANAPYGGKSHEDLLQHGRDMIRFLQRQNVKAVVLACGTTSSTVYEQLVAECDLPLVDVIRPGVKACAELAGQNQPVPQTSDAKVREEQAAQNSGLRVGLIATAATIKSGLFERLLKAKRPDISLLTQACPLFAPMVEAGITQGTVAKWAAETYIGEWRDKIDALVLGCTHYPMLADTLKEVLGADVQFINLASYTAQALKDRLVAIDGLNDSNATPIYKYYVSGNPDAFNNTARFLLNSNPRAERLTSFCQHKSIEERSDEAIQAWIASLRSMLLS